MTLDSSTARSAALVALLVVVGTIAVKATDTPLTRQTGFVVTTPRDGARIGTDEIFTWAAAADASTYAVIVDSDLPKPGKQVKPGAQVIVVDGRSVALTFGPATGGSPSARNAHTVTVLPLDDAGRRLGIDVAVVHVRAAS